MDMDSSDEEKIDTKKSYFKLDARVFEPLQITNYLYNVVLWNQYQILLFENCDFLLPPITLEPEFKLLKVILHQSLFFCLDIDGNIHCISIDMSVIKQPLPIPFEPILRNVHAFLDVDDLYFLSLMQAGAFTLCIHEKSNLQKIIYEYKLDISTDNMKSKEEIILKTYKLNDRNKECVSLTLKNKAVKGYLVIIVLDGRTIYGTILNSENTFPTKLLHNVPSDIRDIVISDYKGISLFIALKSGTIVELAFGDNHKKKVFHLNTSILRIIAFNQGLYYVDGKTMWKSSLINKECFRQIFVKYPRDFIKINHLIICTTYTNGIYRFCYEDDIFISDEKEDDKQPVENFLSGYGFLEEQYNRNMDITTKLQKERLNYCAIALSTHLDDLMTYINVKMDVFDNYADAPKNEITLTNVLSDYFKPNLTLLSINMTLKDEDIEIVNIFTKIKTIGLHIVLDNDKETKLCYIKNLTFKDTYFVPVFNVDVSNFKVTLKLTCPIESTNINEPVWIVLFNKELSLSVDNFVKVHKKNTEPASLKSELNFEQQVLKILYNQHGLLYNINVQENRILNDKFVYYIKLKDDYQNRLVDKNNYRSVKDKTAEKFIKEFSNKEFYTKPDHTIHFDINQYIVLLEILKDNDDFILKITSDNAKICFLMRNFFFNVLQDGNLHINNIPQCQYTALEELRRKLTENPNEPKLDEVVLDVADEFHRKYLSEFPV